MYTKKLTTRLSLRELERPENAKKKNDFLKAWKLIKELPPSNPNSFWSIASFHGMPFKARRVEPLNPEGQRVFNSYCQHGNVLFPTWHRFYCLRLEQALQTVVPDGDVALHYWDTTSAESLADGIPDIVLRLKVTIDGEEVDNPLCNFTLPLPLEGKSDSFHVKEVGYTTTRYPLSGITNPPRAKELSDSHNKSILELNETPEELLQENVVHWLNIGRASHQQTPANTVYDEFAECLDVPDYNAFSNTTSSAATTRADMSIEQSHNSVHLMVGGFSTPKVNPEDGSVVVDGNGDVVYRRHFGLVSGANGEMAANEVASFDPIFFLHHCNVDRMFWIWQKKWGFTSDFTIVDEGERSGTTPIRQGMTPNQSPDTTLGMDTILYPFQNELGVPVTSRDCINIEEQMCYTYSIGSLDKEEWPEPSCKEEKTISESISSEGELWSKLREAVQLNPKIPVRAFFNMPLTEHQSADVVDSPTLGDLRIDGKRWRRHNYIKVQNMDKDSVSGSFVVQAFYKRDGKLFYLGQRAVLDRWERENCPNCRIRCKAAVSFLADDVVKTSSDLKNVLIHIVSKDPESGKMRKQVIDMATHHHHEDGDEPDVCCVTCLKEEMEA